MANRISKKSFLFMYGDIASPAIGELEQGSIPQERLAGFYQLKKLGWNVRISDSRWTAKTARMRRKFGRFVHLPSWKTILDWNESDIVVVKDEFSFLFTIICKLLRKKIVYFDSMFTIPKQKWKRIFIRFSLLHADCVIGYSKNQAKLWSSSFLVPESTFVTLPYCLDLEFYRLDGQPKPDDPPYILSVGRDIGRDMGTLIKAAEIAEINLKIVTLPYLLPDGVAENDHLEVHQRLSYSELFELYKGALLVVVPLKKGITYPSGTRAVLESMALGIPTIASRTPVLEEYFTEGYDLKFTIPEDPLDLANKIMKIAENKNLQITLVKHAQDKMNKYYKLENYILALQRVFLAL